MPAPELGGTGVRRREVISLLGGATGAWPMVGRPVGFWLEKSG